MVKITFAKGARTIEVLDDVYSKEEAQAIAEQNRAKAFGMITGLMKMFDKIKKQIVLSGYQKRYEPFWHIVGEGVQEYKRRTPYSFHVKQEVRSVMFNGKTIPVDEDHLDCHFEAEDHCFEQYSKEALRSAVHEQEKNLDRYLGSKRHKARNLESVENKDTIIEPINIRASYIVNLLIKELVRPIQADKIIQEFVEIKRLALILKPVHVFEFKEEGAEKGKTIEVDAVTGIWRRGERLLTREMKKHLVSEGMFEIGSEIAATLIPGAGVAAVIGKQLHERQEHKRQIKQTKKWRKAYETRKKK
jgi:hypothetical protein